MIQKLLIANRGEIAIRIMETCRKLGIASVAVHSEADSNALFVQQADEAVCVGPAPSQESYLNIPAILEAAKRTGSDAIHPGYGFLSENAEFAEACHKAKILFVGPSPKTIREMGSKTLAKQLAVKHDVPVIPGYNGKEQSKEALSQQAIEIGFPVLLKASAGGGGKGMRVVSEKKDLSHAIDSAKREAKASFGDDTLLVEKYFTSVRHIEIQVLGDQHGHVIHCFERECSLQRRHQKIIEETPAVGLSEKQRNAMGAAAIRVAKATHYVGAGTIEFIVDESGDFYFLEMNTRLQVEHPITEAITGLDLVAWQLRIAEGAPLTIQQSELAAVGHAVECRLYAEDPQNQFLPCTGNIHYWNPGNTEGIRYDTGVTSGSEISIYYDPMIAKIVTHAEDRATATRKMTHALRQLSVLGITTNQGFLIQLLQHPEYQKGALHTGFIDEHFADGISAAHILSDDGEVMFAVAGLLWELQQPEALNVTSPWKQLPLSPVPSGSHSCVIEGKTWLLEYERDLEAIVIRHQEQSWTVTEQQWSDHQLICSINGHRQRFSVAASGQELFLSSPHHGHAHLSCIPRFPDYQLDSSGGDYQSPLPGKILKILVSAGDTVAKGDALLVIESMKMENTISAHTNGSIAEVWVQENQLVESGVPLLEMTEA